MPDDGLTRLPADVLYKADARSRVWRVQGPRGPVVVKRFEYSPTRQRLAAMIGRHPAQRERRANQRLVAAGVAVVPIIDAGIDAGRHWLATPWCGESLQARLRRGSGADTEADRNAGDKRTLALALGRFVARLVEQRWYFRDLKPSNILVDTADKLRLIDVGDARRLGGRRQTWRMLATLDRTARRDGATRTQRLRAARELLAHRPELGPLRALVTTLTPR
ncbi:MAG: lipopolysaccharide kinase InaA family protein [Phycisphaeraceae bacterium]